MSEHTTTTEETGQKKHGQTWYQWRSSVHAVLARASLYIDGPTKEDAGDVWTPKAVEGIGFKVGKSIAAPCPVSEPSPVPASEPSVDGLTEGANP